MAKKKSEILKIIESHKKENLWIMSVYSVKRKKIISNELMLKKPEDVHKKLALLTTKQSIGLKADFDIEIKTSYAHF